MLPSIQFHNRSKPNLMALISSVYYFFVCVDIVEYENFNTI